MSLGSQIRSQRTLSPLGHGCCGIADKVGVGGHGSDMDALGSRIPDLIDKVSVDVITVRA